MRSWVIVAPSSISIGATPATQLLSSMCTSGTPLTFHAFVPTVVGRLIPSDANNGTKVESQYQPSKNSSYRWAHSSSWNLNPEIKRDVVSCLYESEFQARTASLNSKDNLRAWFQELGGRKLIPRVQTFVIRLSVLRCSCGPDFQNESHIIEGLYSKNIFC